MKQDWQTEIAVHMTAAERMMVEIGHIPTIFILYLPDGTKKAFSASFIDGIQKSSVLRMMNVVTMALNADALGTIIEAWAASAPIENETTIEEAEKKFAGFRASEAPDRFEVIHATLSYYGEDGMRQTLTAMGKIKRDAMDKVTHLSEIDFSKPGDQSSGIMPKILLKERAPADMRERAAKMWREQGGALMLILGIRDITL